MSILNASTVDVIQPQELMSSFQQWSVVVTNYLERHGPMPDTFKQLIAKSVLRQLDSAMIIEDGCLPFPALPHINYSQPLPDVDNLEKLHQIIAQIEQDGFAPHFHALISEFGHIMTILSGSDEQQNEVAEWVSQGYSATFLMTDAGGAALKDWKTVYNPETGILTVDKIWGIGADTLDFATIVASQPGSMIPLAFQVPPEACRHLHCSKIGMPYLEGEVQLGNCSGEIKVQPEWVMRKGGILAVKQFLSIIRPFFVRALMAHVNWLEKRGRLTQTAEQKNANLFLSQLSQHIHNEWSITRYSEDEVMALKFASNALLFDLVESNAVQATLDQRDLLSFTKMEGSSYRCFLEIYSRAGNRKC